MRGHRRKRRKEGRRRRNEEKWIARRMQGIEIARDETVRGAEGEEEEKKEREEKR